MRHSKTFVYHCHECGRMVPEGSAGPCPPALTGKIAGAFAFIRGKKDSFSAEMKQVTAKRERVKKAMKGSRTHTFRNHNTGYQAARKF